MIASFPAALFGVARIFSILKESLNWMHQQVFLWLFLSSVKAMASINRASMSSETPDGMWLRSPIQKLIPAQQSKALNWTLILI